MASLLSILAQTQGTAPTDCLLTGLCGLTAPAEPTVAPGILFVALGMVAFGAWGLRRGRSPGA
jgi:hypothetical protein